MEKHDFLRQLPSHGAPVTSRIPVWQAVHLDGPLLLGLILLMSYGLFVLYSAAGTGMGTLTGQATRLGIGFTVMIVMAQIPPSTYRRWTPVLYCVGIVLLGAVLVMGSSVKGAQRWLDLPGLPSFQPSEIMKLAVPMMVAWYLAEKALPPARYPVLASLMLLGIPTVLINIQPDLGTSILIAASGFIVLWLSGLSWFYIISAITIAGVALPLYWMSMHDYQRGRVLTFLDPQRDPLGSGWNIIQSKTAIGSGGFNGKGWLHGTQSHLDFLPESSTDFIIAVLAEELGFIGVICLLLIYLFIIIRGVAIATYAQDTFCRLVAGAITLTFFLYVFVNIGMVSGLLPVVGVPLPLVSYGGTSVVTLLAGFGILMSIHTHKKLVTT